ncbi:IMV membrane protein (Cop-L1R) [Choristoneura rosaceana entomopoxvirus 'L']|uniref:IMV membrane protein (Cop-L1R) n=1 Tax=Choristoneura rosaceana entomopoxvirus 'L' TaxID=1293539 RepID=A0ABM9QKN8_9POXV|nr:IMV membrane protein (Cop-L1R) [Choristoneura rosaceana entomopoxvirus 'L']CCU56113.1 IMV membrane protein (Cop-L1R) [Choristoneura rosaceana entomopoxvirus 'L']
MGVSASINTIVTDITNRVENSLIQSANASAQSVCRVSIGSISFQSTQGCTVEIRNLCSAEAISQVDAVVDATIEFYNDLTFEQKQEAPKWFTSAYGINTTVTTIENDFRNLIDQRCKSEALLESTIEVQNILVKDCRAPGNEIVRFIFTNSGTASGQCAISALLDLQVSGANEVSASQSQGTDISAILLYVIIGVVVVAVAYVIVKFFSNRPSPKQQINLELARHGAVSSKLIQLSQYISKVGHSD